MSDESNPRGSFRAYLQYKLSPSWLSAKNSAGFFGVTLSLPADEAVESWTHVSRFHLLDDADSPDDVLPVLSKDRRLPRYPLETALQHRTRLWHAWDIYELGGTEAVIEAQLRAAGYGPTILMGDWGNPNIAWGDPAYVWGDLGAYVEYRPLSPGPRGEPAPYRTQFWVVFGNNFHPVTGPPNPWGNWTWGDTWLEVPGVWAPTGLTIDFLRTVLQIVMKWKDAQYVFRGFVFQVSNIIWGDPSVSWGDPTITWDGSVNLELPIGANVI